MLISSSQVDIGHCNILRSKILSAKKGHKGYLTVGLLACLLACLFRLNHLDKPLELKFPTIQGAGFDIREQKGNVVVVIFWSAESPHSLMWMQSFRSTLEKLPKANVRVATVSLDTDKKPLSQRLKEFQIEGWPTNFDGRGWDNAVARPLGVNALPTVFILDKSGVLRALNACDNYGFWITKLLKE